MIFITKSNLVVLLLFTEGTLRGQEGVVLALRQTFLWEEAEGTPRQRRYCWVLFNEISRVLGVETEEELGHSALVIV